MATRRSKLLAASMVSSIGEVIYLLLYIYLLSKGQADLRSHVAAALMFLALIMGFVVFRSARKLEV